MHAPQPIPKKSQQIKTDKPRPHICTICTRAFARLEHLKRHERSHTNEKPFQCAACGRCFARRDLVLRHQQKLHTDLPNVIRRGSKDGATSTPSSANSDANEHIIVLHNNTRANAPLPGSSGHLSAAIHSAVLPLGARPMARSMDASIRAMDGAGSRSVSVSGASSGDGARSAAKPARHSFSVGHDIDLGFDWETLVDLTPATTHLSTEQSGHPTPGSAPSILPTNASDLFKKDFLEFPTKRRASPSSSPRKREDLTPHSYEFLDDYGYGYGQSYGYNYGLMLQDDPRHDLVTSHPPSHETHTSNPPPVDAAMVHHDLVSHDPQSHDPQSHEPVPMMDLIDLQLLPDLLSIEMDMTPMSDLAGLMGVGQGLSENLGWRETLGEVAGRDLTSKVPINITSNNTTSNNSPGLFTSELRTRIMTISNLSDAQFPPLVELNNYMMLYQQHFNRYFPFIHVPSLHNSVDKVHNIPLLLAMASVGALYSYHDATTLLLFNLLKYHIQNFFEKEVTHNLQFKKVPLMAHQCLVLHIFILTFLNEPSMIDVTSRQLKSMVGLVKSTSLARELDKFLIPPDGLVAGGMNGTNMGEGADLVSPDEIRHSRHGLASSNGTSRSNSHPTTNPSSIQAQFDYFIMAQSRIRTIFTFYMLQQLRTSTLLDQTILLPISSITSGTFSDPKLWECETSEQWWGMVGPVSSIVELLNNGSIGKQIDQMVSMIPGPPDSPVHYNSLLQLFYVHESIQEHYNTHHQPFFSFDHIAWRLNNSSLNSLILAWEMYFTANGGVIVINEANHAILQVPEFKLILPLYYLAKIKVAVNLTPIVERVVYKDWDTMNSYLNHLHNDFDGLKELVAYSIEIMSLWNHHVVLGNQTPEPLKTPVFFVMSVFIAVLLISQFLYYVEQINDKDHKISLGVTEKVLWLKCEAILKNCEKIISLNYSTNLLDFENYESIRRLIETNNDEKLIVNSLKLIKLSNKCLFLGVRILGEAPVWPLTMGFGEALKNRANYTSRVSER